MNSWNQLFTYVASIKEIAEDNDYNLNIPRYVDTFEEEELVDLETVSDHLIQLDSSISQVDQMIAKYCEELNIRGLQ